VFTIGDSEGEVQRVVTFPEPRGVVPVEPMTEAELRSIAFADADGWRCFYPASRGHLTAAEARAVMRRERGLPEETAEEAQEAEFLLTMEIGWAEGESLG
jgi:hypothetical protein